MKIKESHDDRGTLLTTSATILQSKPYFNLGKIAKLVLTLSLITDLIRL